MEMKRELYSNSIKELEVQSIPQKKMTSVHIKVVVPRRSSAKPNLSPKDNTNTGNRVKSISSTGTRKSTLESSIPVKEKIVTKTPKDSKGKIVYNNANTSNTIIQNNYNPFSPVWTGVENQEKSGPLKQGKFWIFVKPKTSSTQSTIK